MTQSNTHPSQKKDTVTDKVIGGTVGQTLSFISWFFFAILFSIIIEWCGMLFGWWNTDHARNMLIDEIGYLSLIEENSLLKLHPVDVASAAIDRLNTLYDMAGIGYGLQYLASAAGWLSIGLSSAIDITYTLIIRVAIVLLAMPAFILWGVLGLIDGLVARDIRKAGGGVESSFVYHRVKAWVKPSIAISSGFYLTLPFSINPGIFFIIPQLMFFTFVFYTASTFKKFI